MCVYWGQSYFVIFNNLVIHVYQFISWILRALLARLILPCVVVVNSLRPSDAYMCVCVFGVTANFHEVCCFCCWNRNIPSEVVDKVAGGALAPCIVRSPGRHIFKSLALGRFERNFPWPIFEWILVINGWGIPSNTGLLVQVMVWCRQATSHYLSRCWPRYMSPYGITSLQWVDCVGPPSLCLYEL